jgi:hypothetical protein
MNSLEYYNRQKESWGEKEIEDIRNQYEEKEMTISQIADIHHRTPGSISYKLQSLGIISNNKFARGYINYKNSILYKQIVETSKSNDAEKKLIKEAKLKLKADDKLKLKAETKLKLKTETFPLSTPFREIIEMRQEIADLKKDVKEMLHLMNALYDFESQ